MDVVVLATEEVGDLGLSAVLEVFKTANCFLDEVNSSLAPWRVRIVSLGDEIRTGNGNRMSTIPLSELAERPDLVIVAAVGALQPNDVLARVTAPPNRYALEYISKAHADGIPLAAACTGTYFLAEAGVLDGLRATTSWWLAADFRRRYPRVDLAVSETLCDDGHVTTVGAVVAHLDMALALVTRRSPEVAQLTGRYLLAGDRRTQNRAAIPEVLARGDSLTAAFERWVREHLADQFRITDAARELGLTARGLQRAAQAELGMSPRDFVDEIRLEEATHLLHSTTLTVDAIAGRVGYLNAGTLRTLFRRKRGQTIAEVRASSLYWGCAV
ncbi:GlxA family transcriptional regulator [Nocardia sp. NPDC003693]